MDVVDSVPESNLEPGELIRHHLALRHDPADLQIFEGLQAFLPILMAILELLGRVSPRASRQDCRPTGVEMPVV